MTLKNIFSPLKEYRKKFICYKRESTCIYRNWCQSNKLGIYCKELCRTREAPKGVS